MWAKAASIALLVLTAIPCEASLRKDCGNDKNPAVAIEACSKLLASKSLSKSRRSGLLKQRGYAYFKSRNYYSALDDYYLAIKLKPGDHRAYGMRAFVKARLGKDEPALRDAEFLIKSNYADFGYPYAVRAIVYAYAERRDEALRDIERAKARRGDRRVYGAQELTESIVRELEIALKQSTSGERGPSTAEQNSPERPSKSKPKVGNGLFLRNQSPLLFVRAVFHRFLS